MIPVTDTQLFAWLAGFLLPLFRVAAMFTAAPVLSNRAFPARAKVALAGLVAALAAPFSAAVDPSAISGPAFVPLVARELLVGATIGFTARLLFASFEMAGELIGLQMGLSFAGFFDPQTGAANAVGRFVNNTAMLAFIAVNGPLALIATVIQSFAVFPAGDASFAFLTSHSPVRLAAELFALGLNLALPFIALLLFINIALGVISRVAPQLSIFAVGFPVTVGAGLLLLTIGLPAIAAPMADQLARILDALSR